MEASNSHNKLELQNAEKEEKTNWTFRFIIVHLPKRINSQNLQEKESEVKDQKIIWKPLDTELFSLRCDCSMNLMC